VLAGKALLPMLCLLAACTQRERTAPPAPDAAAVPAASPGVTATAAAAATVPAPIEPRPRSVAPVASVPAVPPSDWVWRSYRGDQFTVLFPGEPRVSVLPPEEDKAGYSEAAFDVPGGQVSFAAGYTEHSQEDVAKPESFLDDRANAPRRGSTEVLHKRSVTLPGGQPGRVLIQRRNISGTPLRVYSRLYLVGRRLYSLIVSTLDVGGISEDVVKKFMDSFKLV
jgi:hypothetical protein